MKGTDKIYCSEGGEGSNNDGLEGPVGYWSFAYSVTRHSYFALQVSSSQIATQLLVK